MDSESDPREGTPRRDCVVGVTPQTDSTACRSRRTASRPSAYGGARRPTRQRAASLGVRRKRAPRQRGFAREAGHLAAYGGQCVLIPSALPGAADVLCGESTC